MAEAHLKRQAFSFDGWHPKINMSHGIQVKISILLYTFPHKMLFITGISAFLGESKLPLKKRSLTKIAMKNYDNAYHCSFKAVSRQLCR